MASKGRKRDRPRPWQTGGPPPAVPSPGERRASECGSKVGHANQVAAEQAAIEHERRFGEPKGAYHCRWCGRWHVGTPR